MAKGLTAENGDQVFLLAAVAAVAAAVFLVTVWAPLQVRAFTAAAGPMQWATTPFTTADGTSSSLKALDGKVRVVTMLYTHCPGACPMAVATLQSLESRLTAAQRGKLSIVGLSLDPEHDTLARLQEFRGARLSGAQGADSAQWVLGRPSEQGVRQIADGLGISYRLVGTDSVDHQSVFVLLDRKGEVLARSSNTRNVDPAFLAAVQRALGASTLGTPK